jgi:hypothetical protein
LDTYFKVFFEDEEEYLDRYTDGMTFLWAWFPGVDEIYVSGLANYHISWDEP